MQEGDKMQSNTKILNLHPEDALVDSSYKLPSLSPVEHFAGTERFVKKALEKQKEMNGAFDITIDLEDGAPRGKEQDNLDMAVAMLQSDNNKFNRIGVRIHDFNNNWWLKEVKTLCGEKDVFSKLAYITIPKCYGKIDLTRMISYIKENYMGAGRFLNWNKLTKKLPLHIIIETQRALYNLRDILNITSHNIEVLDFGLMDFVADHEGVIDYRVMSSPLQFKHPLIKRAKAEVVATALANGIVPAHNVTLNTEQPFQAREDATKANKDFGFLRMWSIHINQIEPILNGFRSSNFLVDKAANVLIKAQDANWVPIKYEGNLEDRATYRYYWSILKRAKKSNVNILEEANNRFFNFNIGEKKCQKLI